MNALTAGLSSWCEVDAGALRANVLLLRRCLRAGTKLGIVVKGNAYGHGLLLCACEFLDAGADWLIVNSLGEAELLRREGFDCPLYICSGGAPANADRVAATEARIALYDGESARALAAAGKRAGRPVRVHIKLETGMNRQGLGLEEALQLAKLVERLDGVELEGVTTHYADSDDPLEPDYRAQQTRLLEEGVRVFAERGFRPSLVHSANSAATLLWPDTHSGLVRVGLSAYGLWPSSATREELRRRPASGDREGTPELRPALTWKCRISQVKEVPAGGYVGYGRTYRTADTTRLAVLPVGYCEGVDRGLSNRGEVLIRGKMAPVRGRVCMNMITVEVTHIEGVEAGDEVTLLGRDGSAEVSADQWATWLDTINYEVVTRIHPDLPRLRRDEDGDLSG